MPRAVGLDLGRRTGYACADSPYLRGWHPRSRLEGPRASNEGLSYNEWRLGEHCDHDTLYGRLWERLTELHRQCPINLLAFESAGAHFDSEAAVWVVVGLCVVGRTWAKMHGVTPYLVNNNRMKKHATGNGHAKKPEIMAAAAALGWEPQTENVGDALFVLDLCLTEFHRPP